MALLFLAPPRDALGWLADDAPRLVFPRLLAARSDFPLPAPLNAPPVVEGCGRAWGCSAGRVAGSVPVCWDPPRRCAARWLLGTPLEGVSPGLVALAPGIFKVGSNEPLLR
jgi:hypothetical protein